MPNRRATPVVLSLASVLAVSFSGAEPRHPRTPPPPPSGGFEAPPPVTGPGVVQPDAVCSAMLFVRQTQGARGCTIDERVTHAPGALHYPCAGGAATALFGTTTFTGTVVGGVVDLRLSTRFHFTDGCDWESAQTISGNLGNNELVYVYREAPLPGQARCANACVANGSVNVRQ